MRPHAPEDRQSFPTRRRDAPFAALPFPIALSLAAIGGMLFALSFPSPGWWFLAYPGVACMLLAAMGQRLGGAAWVGLMSGVAFWMPCVSWISRYLGPVPWFALAFFEAGFFVLGAMALSLAYRWVPRVIVSIHGRVWLVPGIVAALWTGREWFAGSWPYQGFAWGRVGLSQSQGPFAHLAAYTGVLGLSFIVVYCVAVVLSLVLIAGVATSVKIGTSGVLVAAVLAVPAWPTNTSGSIRVQAVQGNGPAGYFDRAAPGTSLEHQVAATTPGKNPDLVVWPEASAEFDPRTQPVVAEALNRVLQVTGAPIVAGAITESQSGTLHNTSFVWGKDGWGGSYDKRRPVPFGEYVPDRWLYSKIAPSLIGLLTRDYTPGTKPNVLSAGGYRVGISICFDIVDDGLAQDMGKGGADVLLAQTNNADFRGTDENLQQLEIARLRAIETGRSLVNISTVGASQVIDPSGRTIASVPQYTSASMVSDVPIGTTTTPATVAAGDITLVITLGGALSLVACAPSFTLKRRRSRRSPL